MTDQNLDRPPTPGNSLEAARADLGRREPTASNLADPGGEEPCPPTLRTGATHLGPSEQVPA